MKIDFATGITLGADCLLTSAKVLLMEKHDEGCRAGTWHESRRLYDHRSRMEAGQSRTRLPGLVLALLR